LKEIFSQYALRVVGTSPFLFEKREAANRKKKRKRKEKEKKRKMKNRNRIVDEENDKSRRNQKLTFPVAVTTKKDLPR